MFQYTHETILHGVADKIKEVVTGVDNPYTLATGVNKLTIRRAGEYFSDCILPATVYVTEGHKGAPGKLTLDFNGVFKTGETDNTNTADNEAIRYGLFQLQFRVKTPNQYFAEYASPNWQVFGKPILVGFEISEAETADEAKCAEKIAKAIRLAVPEGNEFIKVEAKDGVVTIDATSDYMTFDKVLLEKYDPTVCDSCLGEYNEVPMTIEIVDNVLPFATADWLVENLRFPTYPNIRYASASEDERPIPGEIYTQYSFSYQSPRPGFGGQSGVGQGMTAVTRHIFYVTSAEKDTFEGFLKDMGLVISRKAYVGIDADPDEVKDGYEKTEE